VDEEVSWIDPAWVDLAELVEVAVLDVMETSYTLA
jgi:hypothetical protein